MLFESLCGALCDLINGFTIREEMFFLPPQDTLFLRLQRVTLLSSLMTAAFLFYNSHILYLLFWSKGFFVGYTLCTCASSGLNLLKSILPEFIFETLLPLPAVLLLGAVWLGDIKAKRTDLRPIVLVFPPIAIGLLLERLIIQ